MKLFSNAGREQASSCQKESKQEIVGFSLLGVLGWNEQEKGLLIQVGKKNGKGLNTGGLGLLSSNTRHTERIITNERLRLEKTENRASKKIYNSKY